MLFTKKNFIEKVLGYPKENKVDKDSCCTTLVLLLLGTNMKKGFGVQTKNKLHRVGHW